MPRIQQYMSDESASGPQEAMSPNIELSSSIGRGVQDIGRNLAESSEKIYTRQAQIEQGQAVGDVSQQRVDDLQNQQEAVANGTWDNDKYKQNFQQWQQDNLDNYETNAGKNTFLRQSNRLLGAILTRGNRASQMIAVNNAQAQYQGNVDNLATATRLAPDTFMDNLHAAYEQSADLPAAAKPHADTHAEQTLAREAVLGTANTDPKAALSMLQNKEFASYLDPKEMDSLYSKVKTAQNYQDGDRERADNLKKKADAATMNKYLSNNLDDVASGKMTPQQILLNAPNGVDFETRLAFAQKAKQAQSLVQTTSPAVMRSVQDRMLLPKDDPNAIVDVSQLVKQTDLAPNDIVKLQNWYFKTPQGASEKQNEKNMMSDIKGKLKVNGIPDQDYESRVVNAMADYQDAKKKMIDNGENPVQLTDPHSKFYFPLNVRPTSALQIMQQQAATMRGDQTGGKTIVHSTPGVIPPLERQMQDGRTALFDPNTKKFLKYKGQ